MEFQINISALISTDYALTKEQLETRLQQAIELCTKDCSIDDIHIEVIKL